MYLVRRGLSTTFRIPDERVSDAGAPGARGAADTMHKELCLRGKVVIDDVFKEGYVDTCVERP